ncbi:MAG: phytanoyl-CoA dioxygenase family protein [Planctomycetota bacterium]
MTQAPTTTPPADDKALRDLPMTRRSLDRSQLLTTRQMAEFVSEGFLRFDELIPKELCEELMAELNAGLYGPYETEGAQWNEIWPEPLAAGRIFRLPAMRGIIESLVGPHPRYDHHAPHMRKGPDNGHQALHQDAEIDPRRSGFDIQISLFPHDIGPDMGGTLFVPGTHFRRVHVSRIGRYQNVVGQVQTACKAGTIVVWHTGLWHAGRANRTDSKRYMFKLRLNPMVRQLKLWNADDLHDPAVRADVARTLNRRQPWMGVEDRLEKMQRVKLWRELTDDSTFDLNMYWTRTGNAPQQGYTPLPG